MVDIIERNELEQLVARGDVVLVDALPAGYYNQQHLPGAINIVEAGVDAVASDLIPDRATHVVTYLHGPDLRQQPGGRPPAAAPRIRQRAEVPRRHRGLGAGGQQDRVGRGRLTVPATWRNWVAQHALGHPTIPPLPTRRRTSA